MKATLREILDNLGVPETLEPYGSWPWSAYDADEGLTCTAEVRMDGGGRTIEVDVQFIHDTPAAGTPSMEQVMFMPVELGMNGKWSPTLLRVQNELFSGKIFDWETKGCNFFSAIAGSLARNEIPDIETLIEKILNATDNYGTGTASGGSRKPSIRPEQLLDPTKKF
jgi:hypothetical protein